ncbi:MAG: L,D-transpeptidase [Pseudolabrys sp.]|jgi:hypothetical protein
MQLRRYLVVIFALAATLATADLTRADVLIKVDKAAQHLTVTVDGVERYQWPVSTARPGYTTPNGVYRPIRLEQRWFSRKYDDAPMPYSIFFHGGYAIHGSYELSRIGKPASHGCVRLNPKNAKVLFKLVKDEGIDKTQVVVEGPAASAYREAHLARSPSTPPTPPNSRPHAISAKGRVDGAQSPRFVGPFEALFSYLSNHMDNDKTQVASKERDASAHRMDAQLAHSAAAPATHHDPRRPSSHAMLAAGSRVRPHVKPAHQNPSPKSPKFVGPFEALFSSIRNHQGIDEARVASKGPAATASRMEAHLAHAPSTTHTLHEPRRRPHHVTPASRSHVPQYVTAQSSRIPFYSSYR